MSFLPIRTTFWHADKVARQVEALQTAERGKGDSSIFADPRPASGYPGCPAKIGTVPGAVPRLVFCDAAVIDAAGRPLHDSFLRQNRLPYQSHRPLATLLGRCFVLGCASAVNRALLQLALPLPPSLVSHDWWLALCAAAAGQIACLDAPLLDYRRHAANASQPAIWNVLENRDGWRQRWAVGWKQFVGSLQQARALRDRLRQRQLSGGEPAELLDAFCRAIEEPSGWRRLRQLHRLGVPAIGGLRRMLYDVCTLAGH